jgi:hypothetical protein
VIKNELECPKEVLRMLATRVGSKKGVCDQHKARNTLRLLLVLLNGSLTMHGDSENGQPDLRSYGRLVTDNLR